MLGAIFRHGARTVQSRPKAKGNQNEKQEFHLQVVTVGLLGALVFVSNYLGFPIPVRWAIFPVSTSATRFACLRAL